MDDTPDFIKKKQHEIWMQKSDAEKLRLHCEMCDFAVNQAKWLIAQKYPHLSKTEQLIEFVKLYYSDCYTTEQFEDIARHFRSLEKKD